MTLTACGSELATRVRAFVREGFTPRFDQLRATFPSNPTWRRMTTLGTRLWLDSGDIEDIGGLWSPEFSALTTNNTLLNREIQKGVYDDFIPQAARLLDQYPKLTQQERKLEMAFILNARHALRLVETFDAYVSVEEHTDLAGDLRGAIEYARRYWQVCPERFIVKIPFSPAGLLATRSVSAEGIPVNHTLGFSARQNYMTARIGKPAYVNVFMGRLNSFVADNMLGGGAYVGEKATLASQRAIRALRDSLGIKTLQIAASLREGTHVRDLAGLDVMTIPCKVAREFLDLQIPEDQLDDSTEASYAPDVTERARTDVGIECLWEIDEKLKSCLDSLENENLDSFTPRDLVDFLAGGGCGDILVTWSDDQVRTSAAEGKIPKLEHWSEGLAAGEFGLDALMNLAGFNSFDTDQRDMDAHVSAVQGHYVA